MAKVGRPSGLNEKIKETILRLLKDGKTEEEVSEVVGVSRRTLCNWKGKHPDLIHAIREAKLTADELVEMSLFQRACGWNNQAPDTTAAMFWLRNRQPLEWREKTEGDVTVNNNVNTLTDEQLDAKIAAIQAKSKVKNAGSK